MTLTFEVYGNPKGRVHTRAFVVKGRAVTAPQASPEQRSWTAAVRDAARAAMMTQGWRKVEEGAIRLGVEFVMPRPQAYNWKGDHAEPRCDRGLDLGNLTKAFEDALNGIVWRDDAMIAEYGPTYFRRYALPGEECRAVARVESLGKWYDHAHRAADCAGKGD